jgi:hypothetical protein
VTIGMIALSPGRGKPFLTLPSCECRVSIEPRRASSRFGHLRDAPKAAAGAQFERLSPCIGGQPRRTLLGREPQYVMLRPTSMWRGNHSRRREKNGSAAALSSQG